MRLEPNLIDDNGDESADTVAEYLAQWGCDPCYDRAPRLRGDGYIFYNYDPEKNSAEYLAEKLLPALDRQLSDTTLSNTDRTNLTAIREYVADLVASLDTSEQCPIIRGAARALFVLQWADREEEAGRSYSGKALEKVAPPTPREATDAAHNLAGRFEQLNGKSLAHLCGEAAQADGVKATTQFCENFGHYLAMQALGHGVSWFDDHARFPLRFPRFDFFWEPEAISC